MARYAYDRLTALDNSFLLLEDPNAYTHVATVGIFDAEPVRTPDGGLDFESIKRATEAVLHLLPRYRQKLMWIPLEQHPVWVDDKSFYIDYHVRHTSLPRPGSLRQLKRLGARIMSQHLDRTNPLWEIWVVEGLEGNRFAIINKIHHCMIDGVAGVDLMHILMRTTPDPEIPEAPPFLVRPPPSGAELLRDEIWRRLTLPFRALRSLEVLRHEARDVGDELGRRARAGLESLRATLRQGSETPFNAPIGPHRRFDWLTMDLAAVRDVRKGLGGSLNDVVLATVTGAVHSFLERRNVAVDDLTFRVLAPVSVRGQHEHGNTLGNRVSAWIVDLPLSEADPARRLAAITEQTEQLKRSQQSVGAELLSEVAEWTPSTLLALGARAAKNWLPFNMVVTNIPGPQRPLYVLGARMLESFPCVPLVGRLGLGVALFSYDGRLFWGFNADWELVPDLHEFTESIERSFAALQAAAGQG